jgi:FkbH-like protein
LRNMNLASYSAIDLLQKRKRLSRELRAAAGLRPIRIAVLGGTTTSELVNLLELILLAHGFDPVFYQSEYNRFFEDAVLEPDKLQAFQPDLVYVHTHYKNIRNLPKISDGESAFQASLEAELDRFGAVWSSLHNVVGCQVIQNNFEHPPALLGNHDAVLSGGPVRFVNQLNLDFAQRAADDSRLLIQDLNSVAARIGLDHWFDWNRWYSYKILTTPEASLAIARSVAAMISAVRGASKKCLVLDLDNTLWGGVIGDDGMEKIQIGKETALAEAYTAFQEYCLSLRNRGVLLAVCSKNNEDMAKSGFAHPCSILNLEHFSAFRANWDPKHENLRSIALELNLGLDSFVFVDDNPAERAIVAAQLPEVAVPDVGEEVALYPSIIQAGHYFEALSLSPEDLSRAELYEKNALRSAAQSKFADYGEYLDSLQMTAEIEPFKPVYYDRITQLINKTNQFNLTTKRYTLAEVEMIARDPNYVTLSGKLIDTFGDNGLVSAIIGHRIGRELHVDLWIMSCRVLKREMESAMLDALVQSCRDKEISRIVGHYIASTKNGMVADHYQTLGFSPGRQDDQACSTWLMSLDDYVPKTRHIRICQPVSLG